MKRVLPELSIVQKLVIGAKLAFDPAVPVWMKAISPIAALAYLVSPVDLIPDMLIGVGQVDDIGVLLVTPLLMAHVLLKLAPAEAVNRQLARLLGTEPAPAPAQAASNMVIDAKFRLLDSTQEYRG